MQKTKSNAKIQNKSKKSKANKNRNTVLSRGGNQRNTSTAASYEVALTNPTKFEITGKGLTHTEYGSGLRCVGRQLMFPIVTTATDSTVFSSTGKATVSSGSIFFATPYFFNDRLASLASLYQRYAFRSMKFKYITRVGTTQVGAMALAYASDSGIVNASTSSATNYSNIQDIEPCKIFPFRKEMEELTMSYSGDKTWYVLYDSNSSATTEQLRQNVQGALLGYSDVSSIGVVNMGELYVEYVVDLYVPTLVETNIGLFINREIKADFAELKRKFSLLSKEEQEKASKVICKLIQTVL
jgi:hypothetical protein